MENKITNGMAQFHRKALLYHCRLVVQIQTRALPISIVCDVALEA